MNYGLRKLAAQHIYDLQRQEGKKPYAFNTIYNRLEWNPLIESYYFNAEDEKYAYSNSDYENENNR